MEPKETWKKILFAALADQSIFFLRMKTLLPEKNVKLDMTISLAALNHVTIKTLIERFMEESERLVRCKECTYRRKGKEGWYCGYEADNSALDDLRKQIREERGSLHWEDMRNGKVYSGTAEDQA